MEEAYKRLLDKFLNEEKLSTEEEQLLDQYYSSFEDKPDILDSISRDDKLLIKQQLKDHIVGYVDQSEDNQGPQLRKRSKYLYYSKIAAAVFFFLVSSVFLYQRFLSNRPEGILAKELSYFEIGKVYTSQNAVTQVQLDDGTLVFLNKNSSLTIDKDFGKKNRQVQLKGEAYFDVSRKEESPFIVHNKGAQVRVLGTTFWINDKDADNYVTLVTGKIQFTEAAEKVLMKPNERLSKVEGSRTYVVKAANLALLYAWKTQSFLFQNVTMQEFAEFLKSRYAIDIVFADAAIKKCKITTTIDGSESYADLLTAVGLVNKFSYRKQNNQMIISGEGCTK